VFHGLDLAVTPDVLIPRAETEELVNLICTENAHRSFETISVLDIGTGSGCIGLAIKKRFPYSNTVLLDISEEALTLARQNATRNNFTIETVKMNILEKQHLGRFPLFHLIVSNPPYVMNDDKKQMHPNVLEHEPHLALFVPDEDPLVFYRAIAEFSISHLHRPGLLYLEINDRFGQEIRKLLSDKGFERAEVVKDFSGKDRFIRAEVKSSMLDLSYWHVEH
jgi:release factor glutamine methyltransferase